MPTETKPAPLVGHALAFNGRLYAVTSWAEASRIVRSAIDRNGWGASQTPRAVIRDDDDKECAHVSYNGRVWPGAFYVPNAAPLFCPWGAPDNGRR